MNIDELLRQEYKHEQADQPFIERVQDAVDEALHEPEKTQSYWRVWCTVAAVLIGLITAGQIVWLENNDQAVVTTESMTVITNITEQVTALRLAADEQLVGSVVSGVLVQNQQELSLCDSETGQRIWSKTCAGLRHVSAENDRIITVSQKGLTNMSLTALRASDGTALWSFKPSQAVLSLTSAIPIVVGQQVVWRAGKQLYAVDIGSGLVTWQRTFSETVTDCVAHGEVLYCVSSRAFYSLEQKTGQITWSDTVPGEGAVPTVAVGADYCCVLLTRHLNTQVITYTRDVQPKKCWDSVLPSGSQCCVGIDKIFIRGKRLRAFNAETGTQLWTQNATGCGAVIWRDNHLYSVDRQGDRARFVVRDDDTGVPHWEANDTALCSHIYIDQEVGILSRSNGSIMRIFFSYPVEG